MKIGFDCVDFIIGSHVLSEFCGVLWRLLPIIVLSYRKARKLSKDWIISKGLWNRLRKLPFIDHWVFIIAVDKISDVFKSLSSYWCMKPKYFIGYLERILGNELVLWKLVNTGKLKNQRLFCFLFDELYLWIIK